jgi:DNA invertase Pin-like site-specific DNA recombinase
VATTLGYARVSTSRQTTDTQHDQLRAAGCERIFEDKISGARQDRPGLNALLDYARPGDTVVVSALDRLGRTLSHIVTTADDLAQRQIVLKSIREGIDYGTDAGRLMAGIFGALAQYERSLIGERAADRRAAAQARGEHVGRRRLLEPGQVAHAKALHDGGETMVAIARTLKVSRATLYRSLARAGLAPAA